VARDRAGGVRSGWGGVECSDSDDVVDGSGHEEPGSVAFSGDVAEFASASDGLDPAEGFLNPFPDALAQLMAAVSGGAPVDRAGPVGGVRRDMRCDPEFTHVGDELRGVVALVASNGPSSLRRREP